MVAYLFIAHVHWFSLGLLVLSTLNWLRRGPGAQYTAAWWTLSVLLGVLALYRETKLAQLAAF